jgi:hypothetical protein
VPKGAPAGEEPELTLVWVGRGEAERLDGGRWTRIPTFDYEFSVEQRRFRDEWISVKHLRREHPQYDGSAGPREQTMYFRLAFAPTDGEGRVEGQVSSSLGEGRLVTDAEFRQAAIELGAKVSAFAPFDRFHISQRYLYEEGRLEELVELNDGPRPWVRNREAARLFASQRFAGAPTRR